jgi:hypothetical protein
MMDLEKWISDYERRAHVWQREGYEPPVSHRKRPYRARESRRTHGYSDHPLGRLYYRMRRFARVQRVPVARCWRRAEPFLEWATMNGWRHSAGWHLVCTDKHLGYGPTTCLLVPQSEVARYRTPKPRFARRPR